MYVEKVPNRGSRPTYLLREAFRQDGKVCKRTVGNITSLPVEQIEQIRMVLKGRALVPADELFETVEDGSRLHGHVEAVLLAMTRLGFQGVLASRPSRERSLVVGMVAARILAPRSKLATSAWWRSTTLPETLGVLDADEDDLYAAMDWLLDRQKLIEEKLAKRHLESGGIGLYDLTSSYFEGTTCPLAARGHNRDGKKGKLQVNFGLLTNASGIPVAVSVFEGNTGDTKTLLPQVAKVREEFGLDEFVLVGDRGMITQKQVDALSEIDGMDWIGALRPEAIKKLVTAGAIQMGLFDERNLFEVSHPDFPGERLVACRNLELAERRAKNRAGLLEATAKELEKVQAMVSRGRLSGQSSISIKANTILEGYRIRKHYRLTIRDNGFDFEVDQEALVEEVRQGCIDPDVVEERLERSRRHVREIERKLVALQERTFRGQLWGQDAIGLRVGKVLNKHKVGKHFKLDIRDDGFGFERDEKKIADEAALDGLYVVRTSLSSERMSAEDAVRSYKLLSRVESAFRSFKTVDLHVRPVRHRLESRVRAHILLCMLAYYVQWHMMNAWRPLLFADEDQEAKKTRDPVAPARRSKAAERKAKTKKLEDGSPASSFQTLLASLEKLVRNTCRRIGAKETEPTFNMDTTPNQRQQKVFDLLKEISV